MAKKTNAQYKAEQYAKKLVRQEVTGEKDLILPAPACTQAQLKELCEREGFGDWRELLLTMIRVAHSDAELSAKLATIAPSGFEPKTKHLVRLQRKPGCDECGGSGFVSCMGEVSNCEECNDEN